MLDALGIARPTERYGRLPRSVRFGPHREGVFVFAPPSAPFHALMVEFFQSRAAPATMRSPDRVVEGETKTPGYYWVLTPREVRALVMWLRQHTRSQNAQRLANRLLLAYRGYLIRQNGGTPPWPRGKGPLASLGDLGAHSEASFKRAQARVKKVVKACLPILKERFGLRMGDKGWPKCGYQGCVYKARDYGHGKRKANVAKVIVGVKSQHHDELDPVSWRRDQKMRSHAGLPTFRRVLRLGKCAEQTGVKAAYVLEREDLESVPRRPDTVLATTLVDNLEKRLFAKRRSAEREALFNTHPQRYVNEVVREWHVANEKDIQRVYAMIPKYPDRLGQKILEQMVKLQRWLATHGLTMSDVKLDNLGLRRHPLVDARVEIVMRDIGFLTLRSNATPAQRRRFTEAHKRIQTIGSLLL